MIYSQYILNSTHLKLPTATRINKVNKNDRARTDQNFVIGIRIKFGKR